jgi:hypothetical protein
LAVAQTVALTCALFFASGCARGENLLEKDQEREAAADQEVVAPTEPEATTRPADLESAPILTMTIEEKQFVPSALTVKPGLYRFRVLNRDAEPNYFWLRRQDGSEAGETFALSIVPGDARNDYYVQLVEGDYLYSAPMPPDAKAFELKVK